MGIVLGIDVGGSTTKIVGLREGTQGDGSLVFSGVKADGQNETLLRTQENRPPVFLLGVLQVRAADQVTSMYGALGNFLSKHELRPVDVAKIYLTGVGASFINEQIYGIETVKVNEFISIGHGALCLTGLDEALVVSMGTGTALVNATKNEVVHLGGSGVGGGTIIGLASQMLGKSDVDAILTLAEKGKLDNIDLSVSDILNSEVQSLPFDLTAANFGKIKSTASDSDIALGIINMVFETAGMLAAFALKNDMINDVIITGSLAVFPQAEVVFSKFKSITGINFMIPQNAEFATALGATL